MPFGFNAMIQKLVGSLRMVLLMQVGLPVLVLLATVLVLGLGFINHLTEERLQRDLKQVARAIRLPVSTALETKDFEQLNSSLESIFDINEVYGAYLFDAQGNFLISLGAVEPTQAQADRAIEKTLDGEFERYENISGRNVYSFFLPLFDLSGRPNGLLQVTRLKSGIEDELGEISLVAWTGFGAVALLIILVLTWAHRRAIGKPLNSLVDSMHEIENGNFDHRVKAAGPDEIKRLVSGLNGMLNAIQNAERLAQQQRNEQAAMAERLRLSETLAALGQLSAGVAHELGAPLTVIDGRAQRLMRSLNSAQHTRELNDIRDQVQRMTRIVRQLLNYGRSSRSERRPMELGLLVQSAVRQDEQGKKRIRIVEGPRLHIRTEVSSMEQVLSNLLRNALQADPNGEVCIGWEQMSPETALVYVQDEGPGIAPEQRSRVLEPFVTTKTPGQGSGLGLAIVQRIVRDHGGQIRITDNPTGQGTRVELTFPLSCKDEPTEFE